MEGIKHELERMEWYLMRNNTKPPEELEERNEKDLEGRIEWSC